MASRIENLPLPTFLTNPTKISKALRQTRAPLRSDAVSCYFDPLLESDALGAKDVPPGELRDGLAAAAEAVKGGRLPIALDVIRRMKALFRDEALLMAGISGPLTLASRLADLTQPAMEVATVTITEIAKFFAEAGANLIFLQERVIPEPDAGNFDEWLSTLTPIFNIIRFYEALPVLQIAADDSGGANSSLTESLANAWPECVVSLPLETLRRRSADARVNIPSAKLGISIPPGAFESNAGDFDQVLREAIGEFRPAIVTTAADLPITTDPKRVAALSEIVRHAG
jgi:hypothetical protein